MSFEFSPEGAMALEQSAEDLWEKVLGRTPTFPWLSTKEVFMFTYVAAVRSVLCRSNEELDVLRKELQ